MNDIDRLPLNQEIKTEERTLFDDYYIVALQGVAMNIGEINFATDDEVDTAARVLAYFAKQTAIEAIKNRANYLYGSYKE